MFYALPLPFACLLLAFAGAFFLGRSESSDSCPLPLSARFLSAVRTLAPVSAIEIRRQTFSGFPLKLVPVVTLTFIIKTGITAFVIASVGAIVIIALVVIALRARLFLDFSLELGFRF